jgi:hypothetical protein
MKFAVPEAVAISSNVSAELITEAVLLKDRNIVFLI